MDAECFDFTLHIVGLSMAVRARCLTDPACVWSWASEPALRALQTEFGADLEWTFVMGGLAREFPAAGLAQQWMQASAQSGMPTDPRVWQEGPMKSTYPGCIAVKAAAEQAGDSGYAYLRRLREGIVCFARKLDGSEALIAEAREAGLDVERFRIDLGSNATVEAFGADLEEAREATLPTFTFEGEGGEVGALAGYQAPESLREAALAAGAKATAGGRPDVLETMRRYGRMAAPEVAAVCDLPLLKAEAELARLALEWRVRPLPVLAGRLWELA